MPCVKQAISGMDLTKEDEEKFDKFWAYFENFWMSSPDFIKTWNINKQGEEIDDNYDEETFCDCHNRTNNGIER